jgi:hypothetical protein
MNNDYFPRFWKKAPSQSELHSDPNLTHINDASSSPLTGDTSLGENNHNVSSLQNLKDTIVSKEDIYAHPNIHPHYPENAGLPLVQEQHQSYSLHQTYKGDAQNTSGNNNQYGHGSQIEKEVQKNTHTTPTFLHHNPGMQKVLFQKPTQFQPDNRPQAQYVAPEEQEGSLFEHEMYGLIGQFKLFEEQQKSIATDTIKYGRLSTAVSSAALFLYYSLHSPVPDGLLAFFAWFYIGLPASIVSSALWKKVARWLPRSRIIQDRREQIQMHFAYKLRQEDYQHELINYLEGILLFVDEHLGTTQSFTHHDLSMQILLLKEAFVLKNQEKAWQHLQIIHQKISFIAQKYDVIMQINQFNQKHKQINSWRHPEDMEFRPASSEKQDTQTGSFSSWLKKRNGKNNDKDDFSNLL